MGAFAARVLMSRDTRLFIVAEGPEVDPTFYSRIAQSHPDPEVRRARVLPVEAIARGAEQSIGAGRSAVLAVHEYLAAKRLLAQENRLGVNGIVCAVDADLAEDAEQMRGTPHLIVTNARDVEAEVFAQADLARAVESLTYADHADAAMMAISLQNWILTSAEQTKIWILLGLTAQSADRATSVTWIGPSLVNHRETLAVDDDGVSRMVKKLEESFSSSDGFEKALFRSAFVLLSLFDEGGAQRVLKGKWLPALLAHHIAEAVPELRQSRDEIKKGAVRAFLDAVDFSAPWADPYRETLGAALK